MVRKDPNLMHFSSGREGRSGMNYPHWQSIHLWRSSLLAGLSAFSLTCVYPHGSMKADSPAARARAAVSQAADPQQLAPPATNAEREAELRYAASGGEFAKVQALLAQGVNIN